MSSQQTPRRTVMSISDRLDEHCSVDDCAGQVKASGMCMTHYTRWYRHGSTADPRPTDAERFWSKVDKSGECWAWTAAKSKGGYGKFSYKGNQNWLAHRWVFESEVGPIPDGAQVDHRCGNRACVNPSHLRLATPGQNAQNLTSLPRNTSGYRGVSKYRGKWQVSVKHKGKNYWRGGFATAEQANEAAIALRNELFTHNELDRRAEEEP